MNRRSSYEISSRAGLPYAWKCGQNQTLQPVFSVRFVGVVAHQHLISRRLIFGLELGLPLHGSIYGITYIYIFYKCLHLVGQTRRKVDTWPVRLFVNSLITRGHLYTFHSDAVTRKRTRSTAFCLSARQRPSRYAIVFVLCVNRRQMDVLFFSPRSLGQKVTLVYVKRKKRKNFYWGGGRRLRWRPLNETSDYAKITPADPR